MAQVIHRRCHPQPRTVGGLKNCTGPPATGHSSVETNDPGDLLIIAPPLEPVLDYLETLAGGPDSADADLLRRFADARDEAAFAAILHRHGPMVLAACRRVLRDTHDAEDAFQAAFLVLARKAGSVHNVGSLAGWLHGVACRVAREARTRAARRRKHEGRVCPREETAPAADSSDLREVLDEELGRLPEKYRSPLVLHYLEGKTKEEAARDLGCTEGTVSGRLARARVLLRDRLTRRGVAPAAALTPLLPAVVPAALAAATLRAALSIGTGPAASGPAVTLAEVTLRGMTLARPGVRLTALIVLAAVSAGGLAAFLTRGGDAAEPPPAPATPARPVADAAPRADQRPGRPVGGGQRAAGPHPGRAPQARRPRRLRARRLAPGHVRRRRHRTAVGPRHGCRACPPPRALPPTAVARLLAGRPDPAVGRARPHAAPLGRGHRPGAAPAVRGEVPAAGPRRRLPVLRRRILPGRQARRLGLGHGGRRMAWHVDLPVRRADR